MADADSVLRLGDKLWIICQAEDVEAVVAFFGHRVELTDEDWGNNTPNAELISRRILITKSSINGKKFSDLRLRTKYGITITRVNRAGVDLIPYQGLELQVGDRVMVVGPGEGRDTGGRRVGQLAQKAQPAQSGDDLRGHRPRSAAGVDSPDERSAAREIGSGRRSADRGDPDRTLRNPLPPGDLYHHERQPDAARNRHRAVPRSRGNRRRATVSSKLLREAVTAGSATA